VVVPFMRRKPARAEKGGQDRYALRWRICASWKVPCREREYEVRRFQPHLTKTGVSICTRNLGLAYEYDP
jgi:hypothetical protein